MTSGYDPDGKMIWDEANTWAENLVYGSYSDGRRLPTAPEGEMYNLYIHNAITKAAPRPFENLNTRYWSGREATRTDLAYYFNFNSGIQSTASKVFPNYAWAVRDGDVFHVPEPATMLLLGLGLMGLAGVRRKFKK